MGDVWKNHLGTELVDIDQDGDVDILGRDDLSGALFLYENLVAGSFSPGAPLDPNVPSVTAFEVIDVDGDQDLDVVYAPAQAGGSFLLPNLGAVFGTPVQISTEDALGLYAVDFDNDGLPDLMGTDFGEQRVWVSPNLGGGSFGPSETVYDGSLNADLFLYAFTHDVDVDGNADILIGFTARPAEWYRNLGGLAFDLGGEVGGAIGGVNGMVGSFEFFASGDVDGDGDEDLLYTSMGAGAYWYASSPGGDLDQRNLIDPSVRSFCEARTADLDGDGDFDVLVADRNSGQVTWFENIGNGDFAAPQPVSTPLTLLGELEVGDLDGDQDPDVVAVGQGSSGLSWMENRSVLGSVYCAGVANSNGFGASLLATGSRVANASAITLTAGGMDPGVFGYFLTSTTQGFTPNPGGSQGNLCLAAGIGRYTAQFGYGVQVSGPEGSFSIELDLGQTPTPNGSVSILAGQTWNFQAWYRDSNPGLTTNFSDAVEVPFL